MLKKLFHSLAFGLILEWLFRTYTAPSTFTAGQLVTANDLNTQLRDNMIALKDPQFAHYEVNQGADYTTTSSSFANVDGTNLSLSITLAVQADVLITFVGTISNSGTNRTFFDVTMDGTPVAGDDGIISVSETSAGAHIPVSFPYWKAGVAAGSHTFNLRWKTNGGTTTMYAGAGTASGDTHPQFAVREVS